MLKIIHPTVKTLTAGLVLMGLSACSVSPINPESSLGHATEKLAVASGELWIKTKHVFRADGTGTEGLPRSNGAASDTQITDLSDDVLDEFKDEVDLALVDDDITYENGEGIFVAATESDAALEIKVEESGTIASIDTEELTPAIQPVAQIMGDYEHVVQENETLWILSKQLTGDATNWRILAELNGLDENGSVFPGQKLHIPADLATGSGIPTLAAAKPADGQSGRLELPEAVAESSASETKIEAVEAVTEIVVADSVPAVNVPTTAFEVQAGETMWDLAKRTTGDATNWKAIAAANEMTDKEAAFIKYGQNVGVPTDLLKSADTADISVVEAKPATEATAEEIVVEAPAVTTETIIDEASAAADGEVKIVPANFTAEPPVITDVLPAAALRADTAAQPVAIDDANGEWVMVSGTYYPKAIYNDANFSAPLLMRVSPGTKLEVARAIGPWFEVKTDHGVGYVHSRDIK